MLPRSVRHCACPPCRLNRGAWNGAPAILHYLEIHHVRPLSSGSTRRLPRLRHVKPGTDSEIFNLGKGQKDELHNMLEFRSVMRKTAVKAATSTSSTTQDMTVDSVIDLTTAKPYSYFGAPAKLKSAYGSRRYEDMDAALGSIAQFKQGGHPLTRGLEGIMMTLGFLKEPVLSGSPLPEKQTSPVAGQKTSTMMGKALAPPIPEPRSLVIETPKDFSTPDSKSHPPETSVRDVLSGPGAQATPTSVEGLVSGTEVPSLPTETTAQSTSLPRPNTRPRIRGGLPNRTDSSLDSPVQKETTSGSPAKQEAVIADMKGDRVQTTSADRYPLTPLSVKMSEVPSLKHDLSRVLFNPGVYQLQDPRSRVWNFDPYLGNLMHVSEFNYDALNKYITSSEDVSLREIALQRGKRYIGSTSSLSGVLVHFHFLLSAFRELNLTNLSRGFREEGNGFTKIQKGPTAIMLRHKDGVYAVDADKEYDSANILMSLGKSMEKLLTSDKEEFERYRKTDDAAKDAEMKSTQPEAYHYSGLGQFLLRSQLDAYDSRLPGTGTFDLKTRAVAAVRMMVRAHEKGVGYQIRDRYGTWESYEREYFDMIRSAFLKYSLQVRMGRMDGIFVAYHNTERLFGFQYVPLTEMDFALHGQSNTTLGDQEFSLSIQILNSIFNEATMKHPGQSLRFHFETREGGTKSPQNMLVFAEPVTEDEIAAIQNSKKDEIRAIEERLFSQRTSSLEEHEEDTEELDPDSEVDDAEPDNESEASLARQSSPPTSRQSNAANVEFLDSILGMDLRGAMTSAPDKVAAEEPAAKPADPDSKVNYTPTAPAPEKPLLAWRLHIRNIVNGLPVVRPERLGGADTWGLQYSLDPLSEAEARRQYNMCKNRRRAVLAAPQDADVAANFYIQNLVKMSAQGSEWRQHQDELDAQKERVVLYND